MIKIGISGFGRIGRLAARVAIRRGDMDIVAINAPDKTPDQLAYVFAHDSVHGKWDGTVAYDEKHLIINGKPILLLNDRNPANLGWGDLGVDYVVECTGKFLTAESVQPHLDAGAKFVLMSAPAKDKTPMFVYGVNHETFDPALACASAASCTTNCLAPLAKVINDKFGIEMGLMSTIHAATSKQKAVDANAGSDWRIGRSVFNNIIPSSTGAAKAVGLVIPELKGKLTGMSYRIPASDVSVVDLTAKLKTPTTYEAICAAVKEASEGPMKGIIEYNTDPIVSCDLRGNFNTSIFDEQAGIMLGDDFVKLIAWYDNEWGYSNKLIDLVSYIAGVDAKA